MKEQEKYALLSKFSRGLVKIPSLDEGLPFISQKAKKIIGADRCSVFIYSSDKDELWTTLSDGVEKIVIPFDMGIVGQTVRTKQPIIENDAYSNSNFLSEIDAQTGYYTRNILTSPVINSKREVIGVFQLLNKETGFTREDVEFITFFAHYVSGFLELEIANNNLG